MTPYEQAQRNYYEEIDELPFPNYLDQWRAHYLLRTPTFFILAKEVSTASRGESIWDPFHVEKNPNAWFILLAAGDLHEAWNYLPHFLPYFTWYSTKRSKMFTVASHRVWSIVINHGKLRYPKAAARTCSTPERAGHRCSA